MALKKHLKNRHAICSLYLPDKKNGTHRADEKGRNKLKNFYNICYKLKRPLSTGLDF